MIETRRSPNKLDPFGNVVNLSDTLFSKSEFSLLNKNLNFCPRPNKYNKFKLQQRSS